MCQYRQFVCVEDEGEGDGGVVGWMERCSRRRQFGIPVLYGRGRVAVRRRLGRRSRGGRPTVGCESRSGRLKNAIGNYFERIVVFVRT